MKCFFCFKEKGKGRTERKPSSTPPASRPVSNSGAPPATSSSNSSGSDSSKQANRSSPASSSSPRRIPALYEERAHSMRVFDLGELRTATNNFSRLLKIGEGGFGSVYRGHIRGSNGQGDRIAVAIKKLNQHSLQGHKQWLAEVQFLGIVEHPNLVKLIGYCAVDGERGIQRLLVYEFMPNRSLEDHLFSRISPVLPWDKRLKICMGVAEGLRYLHEGLEVQVIYRDFKASNILLDGDFKPKLSDFGLAREGPSEGNTHVSTAVVGTYGYAAPDYIETGHLTIKSDVWSFGVVLYEILTGRRSLDRNRPRNEHKLLDWVKQFPVESRRFPMIMDPRLGKQYSLAAAQSIAKLANTCLSKNPKDRPSMSKVIEILKKAIQMSETVGSPEPPIKEQPATVSNGEKRAEQINGSESSKQRILQMARLRQSANVEGRRRLVVQQANRL